MLILLTLLSGAAFIYFLAEAELVIPAFLGLCVFIFFLYSSPIMAWYFFCFIVVCAIGFAIIAFWEQALGIAIGAIMFVMLVGGLLSAIEIGRAHV